jgi:FG-GAP-like repeat/ASPIC and UnbV
VLLLRGGWENRMRLSLLRNRGDGTFEDVTVAAGMAEPISTESAAWGDYDGDGLVDVYVCGEFSASKLDFKNRCRLYRNKGDGTFEDVTDGSGVGNQRHAKGCAWGDFDGDGRLDLFVSNRTESCRLYRNLGDGTFRDEAPALGVLGAHRSFACGFLDYDNDGRLDLLVSDLSLTLAENVALILDLPIDHPSGPRLYRNLGPAGFRDVTRDVGIDSAISAMGVNFGDVDNDGDLDLYFGTGGMSYSYLFPNRMFKNVGGERFEDDTISTGTGHLQKGHGVSFADYDGDGHLDFFVEAGGGVPGDKSYNILYHNAGNSNRWVKVKLVGSRTNRAALGARMKAVVDLPSGARRMIYRTVGNNMSFGGNTLLETLGLSEADHVSELEITWPTSKTVQVFRDIPAGATVEITEGKDVYRTLTPPPMPKAAGAGGH